MHTELPVLFLCFSSFCIWNLTFCKAVAGYISRERIWILTSLSVTLSLTIFIKKWYEDWHPKHWTRSEMESCISCKSHYLRTGLLVFGMWCYVECTRLLIPWRRWRCTMWNQSPHKEVWNLGRLKWLQCFQNLRNPKFIICYKQHDNQKVYIIKHSTIQQIWPSTVTK